MNYDKIMNMTATKQQVRRQAIQGCEYSLRLEQPLLTRGGSLIQQPHFTPSPNAAVAADKAVNMDCTRILRDFHSVITCSAHL